MNDSHHPSLSCFPSLRVKKELHQNARATLAKNLEFRISNSSMAPSDKTRASSCIQNTEFRSDLNRSRVLPVHIHAIHLGAFVVKT
jgi:hypothetical protein